MRGVVHIHRDRMKTHVEGLRMLLAACETGTYAVEGIPINQALANMVDSMSRYTELHVEVDLTEFFKVGGNPDDLRRRGGYRFQGEKGHYIYEAPSLDHAKQDLFRDLYAGGYSGTVRVFLTVWPTSPSSPEQSGSLRQREGRHDR